ncbi:MAG: T9SS type A sorting domain-containing protein, partial [Dysgonamonadaceae bacterium]|nr:T9SS type A sorting domain-containing protein [Dysgonamonadaceae bacterium]
NGNAFVCDGTASATSLTITIPETFVAGTYRIILLRGEDKTQDLGFATCYFNASGTLPNIIAHRGYWDTSGSAQNSVAALRKAQELGVYGSEFDVWITIDGKIVLNHDATIGGIRIDGATYSQLQNITLSNGEKLPTLEDYLAQGKQNTATKLILEFKTHNTEEKNNCAVAAVISMISAENMTEQVEYIAFSLDVCKEIVRLQPGAKVAYLNGDRTPSELHALQITGIDYTTSVLRNHPNWIREAHELGMTVNVWTVNSEADMREMIQAGVDYITTDKPVLGKSLTATAIAAPRSTAEEVSIRYRSPEEILVQSPSEILSVALFDMQGSVRYFPAKSTEVAFPLSGLPAGIYAVRIVTATGTAVRKIPVAIR